MNEINRNTDPTEGQADGVHAEIMCLLTVFGYEDGEAPKMPERIVRTTARISWVL